jgi:hypothetical protein
VGISQHHLGGLTDEVGVTERDWPDLQHQELRAEPGSE